MLDQVIRNQKTRNPYDDKNNNRAKIIITWLEKIEKSKLKVSDFLRNTTSHSADHNIIFIIKGSRNLENQAFVTGGLKEEIRSLMLKAKPLSQVV
jgi:hypothetical protein